MSRPPFQLKRPLGRSYRVDLSDTRRTKEALKRLGYYETPDYGMTDYPDEPMFKAIESFQNDNDLPANGTMRPDDETAKLLQEHIVQLMPTDGSDGGSMWRRLLDVQDFPQGSFYRIRGEVGEGRTNDPEDVRNTKRALRWIGINPNASQGIDETMPDESFFTAIRNYQQAKGLEVDGWMHPGGETEYALGGEVAPKLREWQAANQNDQSAANDSEDIQVAQAGTTDLPISPIPPGATALTGAALLEMMRRGALPMEAETWDPGKPDAGAARTSITPPMPPVPPSEPTREEQGYREEFSADSSLGEVDLSHPIPDDIAPGILVSPMPPEDLAEDGQIQERRESQATKDEIDRIRDEVIRLNPSWKHLAGGRNKKGSDEKEYHIPGPGLRWGDVHTGGNYVDLTFISPSGKLIHVQTVDVDRNGKPTRRELDAAERIRRAEPNSNVILIPKGAQLDKIFDRKR